MRDVLTEKEEAVLLTVDSLALDRQIPMPARVGLHTQPPMNTAEVMLTAGRLVNGGLLRAGDYDGATYYELTVAGDEWVQSIVARGWT